MFQTYRTLSLIRVVENESGIATQINETDLNTIKSWIGRSGDLGKLHFFKLCRNQSNCFIFKQ